VTIAGITGKTIDTLVEQLASDRWTVRRAAEAGLQDFGARAVPALTDALNSRSELVRWGAATVLCDIADPASAEPLVHALEDADGGVRWLAAQALIAVGPSALLPLLRRLLAGSDSPWLHEGAHHVLRAIGTPAATEVVHALEDHFPSLTVSLAASEALKTLESGRSQ
jgi:HEAT repeat protein